jgi:hypothetical protein
VHLAPLLNIKPPKLLGTEPFPHTNYERNCNRNPGFKFD